MKIKNLLEVQDFIQNTKSRKLYLQKTDRFIKSLKILFFKSKTDFHVIERRLKEIKSLEKKLERKINNNSSSVSVISDEMIEITDLSGIRIIVFHLEDVRIVLNLICKQFKVDEINSNFFLSNSEYDRFGYQSIHVIVEWETIKIEVQIRTVLQHAWAAISHKMDYKSEMKSPYPLKRKLSRLSGLIEIADNEFNELTKEYSTQNKSENKGLLLDPIDFSSLSTYFMKSNRFLWYIQCCEFSGYEKSEPQYNFPTIVNLKGHFKSIVECCESLSFVSMIDFDNFLRSNLLKFKEAILLYFKYGEQHPMFFLIDQRLQFLMHLEMEALDFLKICHDNNFHEKYSDLVIKIKKELSNKY